MKNDLPPSLDAGGPSRRGLLKCMGWAGTGVVWSLSGGVPRTLGLVGSAAAAEAAAGELTFVQISDNHIGFHLPPNPDPTATLGEAIAKIKAMPAQPAFLVHTGDISHLSKEEQWDTAEQVIKGANKQVFYHSRRARRGRCRQWQGLSRRALARIRRARAGTASMWPGCILSR